MNIYKGMDSVNSINHMICYIEVGSGQVDVVLLVPNLSRHTIKLPDAPINSEFEMAEVK